MMNVCVNAMTNIQLFTQNGKVSMLHLQKSRTGTKPSSGPLCPNCNTRLDYALGIGSFCPNLACPIADGPFCWNENDAELKGLK